MKLQTIPTKDLSREQWLELRRQGIGGSDAAALVGLNPYATPYTVWADKKGLTPPKEDTEAMRQGRDLEAYVAERWTEETGRKVQRRNAILVNPAYPFALANIDRWVVGANEGLECKTTSMLSLKKYKNGEYPTQYYVQCMHYLAVTGAARWHLAVLVLNQGFYCYVIERDEDEIAALMDSEAQFWRDYVMQDTPPPVSGETPDTKALGIVYADSTKNDTPIELFGHETVAAQYLQLAQSIKEMEKRQEECAQILKADLKEYEKGFAGQYLVSWAGRSRSNFDAKRFAAENPNLDLNPYYKQSSYRTFSIKEIGLEG